MNWSLILQAVAVGLLVFLAAYLRQKAKGLAASEDLAKLTGIVEDIKTEHALLLEATKSNHELRRVAIDRRLQAHQDAYYLLQDMANHRKTAEFAECYNSANKWWLSNCLYLEPKARQAFREGIGQLLLNNSLASVGPPRSAVDVENMRTTWEKFNGSLSIIVESVGLPTIKEEYVDMTRKDPTKAEA